MEDCKVVLQKFLSDMELGRGGEEFLALEIAGWKEREVYSFTHNDYPDFVVKWFLGEVTVIPRRR